MRLILLLLPLGLFADVNLACQINLKSNYEDNTIEMASGEYVITIDEIAKKLLIDEVPYIGYDTEGTAIKFRYAETSVIPQTGILSILNIFSLNKVSGRLLHEVWFSKGIEELDSVQILNTENFDKSHTYEAKCRNVKPLF